MNLINLLKHQVKKMFEILGFEVTRIRHPKTLHSSDDTIPSSNKSAENQNFVATAEEKLSLSSLFDRYHKTFFDVVASKPDVFFGKDFFVRQLLMVDTIRYFVALARYIYFVDFLGNLKVYEPENQDNIRQDIDGNKNTAEYNLTGLHDLSVARSLRLIKPLSVIETYRNLSCTRQKGGLIYDLNCLCDAKLLAIGPRTEGELLCLFAHGFRLENIRGLDLISYSPWVDLGDMHAMPYEENTWDITLVSMVLTYSENPCKVVDEVVRVTKSGGLVGVSIDNTPESKKATEEKYGYSLVCADDILKLFGSWVDRVYFSHDLPEPLREKEIYTASVIFSVSKKSS